MAFCDICCMKLMRIEVGNEYSRNDALTEVNLLNVILFHLEKLLLIAHPSFTDTTECANSDFSPHMSLINHTSPALSDTLDTCTQWKS